MAAAVTRTNESVGANGPAPGYRTHCTPSTRQIQILSWPDARLLLVMLYGPGISRQNQSQDLINYLFCLLTISIYYLYLTRNQKIKSDCKPLFFPPCIIDKKDKCRRLSRIIFTRTSLNSQYNIEYLLMQKMDKIDKSVTKCCPYVPTVRQAGWRVSRLVQSVETGSGPEVASPSHCPVLTDDGKCFILVSVEMVTFRMHLLETGQ